MRLKREGVRLVRVQFTEFIGSAKQGKAKNITVYETTQTEVMNIVLKALQKESK